MAIRGGKRPKAKLTYGLNNYTPTGLKAFNKKQLRKEYSRLRSIANKRIGRFKGTEWEATQIYKYNAGRYVTLKSVKSDRELRGLLSDVARFIVSERGSVSGQKRIRRKAIQTLSDRGFDFVNKKNFAEFGEFMEWARASSLGRLFDSKRVAEFYETTEKKQRSANQVRIAFIKWSKDRREQEKIQNKTKRDSKQYRKALE